MGNLNAVQLTLLSVLKSFMRNESYELSEDFDQLQELFQLAQEHKLSAVVYEQIRRDRIWQKEEYRELLMVWKKCAVKEIMLQMQRTEGFLDIYGKLREAGVQPLVVKGLVCRSFYVKSDYRTSSDEDMLIPKEQFAVCDEILLANGFQREKLDLENLPYEIPYINPQNGTYIELHFTLFSEESGAYGHLNEEFCMVHGNKIAEEIQGKEILTLCPTDHLFYLICHSFKHFLHSGFGVRQVADMMMMAEHYGEQIDWKSIEEKLIRLRMKKYWEALEKIGAEYFGFSLGTVSDVDYIAMLEDLLGSGIYGDSSMERKHSSNMTLTAATDGKASATASIGASLFPSMEYMKKSFSWLETYPWLIPAAYVIRIVRYVKKRAHAGENSMQIGLGRIELLKKFDIIE